MSDRDLAKGHTTFSRLGNWAAIATARACAFLHTAAESRSGATAVEYGIIAAGIAVTIIGVLNLVGDEVSTMFSTISTAVNSASSN